jgi:hypothetical protein
VDDLARLERGPLAQLGHLHVTGDRAVLVSDRRHGRAVQRVQGDRLIRQPHHLDERVAEDEQVGDDAAEDLPDVLARVAEGEHPLEEEYLGGLVRLFKLT